MGIYEYCNDYDVEMTKKRLYYAGWCHICRPLYIDLLYPNKDKLEAP